MNTLILATLSELYNWGGPPFMHPITLLFIVNIGIIVYVIVRKFSNKEIDIRWIAAIKQVAGLAVAFGAFGTIIGLFLAFDALESSKDVIPFPVICGGLKVGLITALYGLIVFLITYPAYIILKFMTHKTA